MNIMEFHELQSQSRLDAVTGWNELTPEEQNRYRRIEDGDFNKPFADAVACSRYVEDNYPEHILPPAVSVSLEIIS